ncbi:NADH-ubiquinone oxidoreductase chain 4L [Gryllus bimaculatus]|nr:NADH-ubiquinone oxidoreductase chain 4L [Gryllus bimaculatus]
MVLESSIKGPTKKRRLWIKSTENSKNEDKRTNTKVGTKTTVSTRKKGEPKKKRVNKESKNEPIPLLVPIEAVRIEEPRIQEPRIQQPRIEEEEQNNVEMTQDIFLAYFRLVKKSEFLAMKKKLLKDKEEAQKEHKYALRSKLYKRRNFWTPVDRKEYVVKKEIWVVVELIEVIIFYCVFTLCEGSLGLGILISMVCSHGNDYFHSFMVLQC